MRLKTFSKKKKKKSIAQIAKGAFVSVGMCVWGEGGVSCRVWGEGGGVVSCEEEGRGCSHSPSHFLATIFTLTLKRKKEKNTVESQDFPLHLQIFKANFCKALFIQVGRQFMPLGYESEGGM